MTDFRATLATVDDVDAVYTLLSAAGDRLGARGFPNWLPPYPRERVAERVSDGIVWIVRDASSSDAMVATYMLRPLPVHPYVDIAFGDPDARAYYLNRLAVHPDVQGRGVGRWCLQRVAEQCADDGASAVRCDVLQANIPLRRFYERNGYLLRGDRFHSGWRFAVYERVIAAID